MIYLNDNIESLDLPAALCQVSPQRAAYAQHYRQELDQRLSLAVYLLLMKGLEKEYGITELPDLLFGPQGKPTLKGHPDIHFNLSHCSRAALCVISDQPVGCDVECVPDELDMDLCHYCFNDEEIASIVGSNHPTQTFTSLWTRKEAFLKFTGEGLTHNLPSLFSGSQVDSTSFHTFLAPDKSYVYTVCKGIKNDT